jgi:translation elongation factor EF-4
MGRRIALRLKDVIDRQNFEIVIQVHWTLCKS